MTWVDMSDLADVAMADGPVVTVQLAIDREVADAAERNALRWADRAAELRDAGAPEAAVAAVDDLIVDAHHRGAALFAVAGGGGLRHVSHWPEPPLVELARCAPLPVLTPLVDWRQALPPHVVVTVDRTGADLVAVRWGRVDEAQEVTGEDRPLTKVAQGGWSQRRIQQRAENTWEHNASTVADAAVDLVQQSGARAVLVAGDVRAAALLADGLPDTLRPLVRHAGGTRADDGAPSVAPEDVAAAEATIVEADHRAALDRLGEAEGHDLAARGVTPVLEALAMARAELVLLHDDLHDDGPEAWFGPQATDVAVDAATLRTIGVQPRAGRLADVVMRAALGTGAAVRVMPTPDHLPGGMAAVLRW